MDFVQFAVTLLRQERATNLLDHWALGAKRLAEITLLDFLQVDSILDVHGAIEAVLCDPSGAGQVLLPFLVVMLHCLQHFNRGKIVRQDFCLFGDLGVPARHD